MLTNNKRHIFWLILLFFSSCSTLTTQEECIQPNESVRMAALNRIKPFKTDRIEIDYIAKCKARIRGAEKSYSGSCQIILTKDLQMLLTILNPLGGTIIKIYANQDKIQVNDFVEKEFYELPASHKKELNIPIVDSVSLAELQSVFWGRLTDLTANGIEYELEKGRPVKLFKKDAETNLVVHYTKWLDYEDSWFPKRINISNKLDGSSLIVAITQFEPGYSCNLQMINLFNRKNNN